jgi:predicted Abi (CAAX) family protease
MMFMSPLFAALAVRLRASLVTCPTPREWGVTALLLAGLALLLVPAGIGTGFLVPGPPALPWPRQLWLAALVLFAPALLEELLFRAALLPHPTALRTTLARWGWGSMALIIFVLSHPVKALLLPHRPGAATFLDLRFLAFASLLGLVCTVSYLRTRSLWPAVMIHWIAVVGWLLWLGGAARMGLL